MLCSRSQSKAVASVELKAVFRCLTQSPWPPLPDFLSASPSCQKSGLFGRLKNILQHTKQLSTNHETMKADNILHMAASQMFPRWPESSPGEDSESSRRKQLKFCQEGTARRTIKAHRAASRQPQKYKENEVDLDVLT